MFSGKTIVILSPQPWDHIYISKHHYAIALAKENTVWFITAPEKAAGSSYEIEKTNFGSLNILRYKLWLPQIAKFKLQSIYKFFCALKLKHLLKTVVGPTDICIDFGCYQYVNDLDFADAKYKILFPVDDSGGLKVSMRKADYLFSVSKNVLDKFTDKGIAGVFINHGLGEYFAERARIKQVTGVFSMFENKPIKIAYSGNLFISFLDIPVLQTIITEHPEIEFNFFGSDEYNAKNDNHIKWAKFLDEAGNVKLHGSVSPMVLAQAYEEMAGFLLCYKPDYKNYHAENSHKVLEYLSTGKVLISTYLSIYSGSNFINMSPKDENKDLIKIFTNTITDLDKYNSPELQGARILFALDNTYTKQLQKISAHIL